MEKEGLIRSLDFLEKSGVKVASLVTDRHTQVQKFIWEQKPNIDHFYDGWHLCKATKPTYRLEKVLMNKRILSDVKKLSPLYHISALEGFHSLILCFAPKNVAFSYLGMLCRLYLAALHFNENSARSQARTASGELRFHIKFPKAKRGEHVVSMVKTSYTTEYVTEFMDLLFNEMVHDPAPFVAEMKALSVPGSLCSQYERPEKADAVDSHVSRFTFTSRSPGNDESTPI